MRRPQLEQRTASMRIEQIFSTAPTVISQEQRESYYEVGYLILPSLIGEEWLQPLRKAVDDIVDLTRSMKQSTRRVDLEPDHTADNPRVRRVAYVDEYDPVFWRLCSDSVITDIAADLLGPNVRFRELMINFKWAHGGAQVKWHQDIAFYPHTHSGTLQFLLMLDGATSEQGPLQLLPGSHKGEIFPHYDSEGNWTGAVSAEDLDRLNMENAVSVTGPPGLLSVHHSRTLHGSAVNTSSAGRPAFVVTYSAADAVAYTAPAYPSVRYSQLVRGTEPGIAHHEDMIVPMPPDWSDGYTSIFEHQEKAELSYAES